MEFTTLLVKTLTETAVKTIFLWSSIFFLFLFFFKCLSVVFKVKFVFCFLQVSHYTFAMCSYHEKQAEPTEMMELDGYTVDYCEAATGREI